MPRYLVRKRKWPAAWKPLQRPWELIRLADGKPVAFFVTPEEAKMIGDEAEKGGDAAQRLLDTNLIRKVYPTGTMRGQDG